MPNGLPTGNTWERFRLVPHADGVTYGLWCPIWKKFLRMNKGFFDGMSVPNGTWPNNVWTWERFVIRTI